MALDTRVKRGFAIPWSAENGRLRMAEGSEELANMIIISLLDGTNANPFNKAGGTQGMIFDVNDEVAQSRFTLTVRRVFEGLQKAGRAQLAPGWPKYEIQNGELHVKLRYHDLESALDEEFSLSFASALAGGEITINRSV